MACALLPGMLHASRVQPFSGYALAATSHSASMRPQAWGEQVAKARRKRGGREGGVLLDKGYIDVLATVREQANHGVRVRAKAAFLLMSCALMPR